MIFVKAEEKKLLVKGLAVRAWVAATVVGCLTASGGASVTALPPGPVLSATGISVVAEGSSERWIVDLGGVLVAALAPESRRATRSSCCSCVRRRGRTGPVACCACGSSPNRVSTCSPMGSRAGSTPWRRSSSMPGRGRSWSPADPAG